MSKIKLPKIGMRNIKTAVSVFFCLIIFYTIDRENAFYACIASVICMQNTVDNTIKTGVSRLIGTAIGGFAGMIVLIAGETYFTEEIYLILMPLGIVLLIEICVALGRSGSVSICCVVFLSILTTHRYEGDYVMYAVNRIIDTSVGVIIALLVNRYLKLPRFMKKRVRQGADDQGPDMDVQLTDGEPKTHNKSGNPEK